MKWTDLRLRLRALFFRKRVEDDLQDELGFHLEMQKQKNVGKGMDPADADREARLKFGGLQKFSEACRDERRTQFIESVFQDIRYAVRQFRHARAFTLVAVLSLGLGIGANTALFAVFDTLYFRKVPVRQPDELGSLRWRAFGRTNHFVPSRVYGSLVTTSDSDTGLEYAASTSFTVEMFDEFRRSAVPADLIGFASFGASADIRGRPYQVSGQLVSGNYFETLGVSTIAGRPLGPADDAPAADPAAVITDFAWNKYFKRDASAIGEKIVINGLQVTIVGVTPPGFYIAEGRVPDFSVPMAFGPRVSRNSLAEPGLWWIHMMARMKPGTAIEQVQAALQGPFQATVTGSAGTSAADSKDQLPRLDVLDGSRGFVEVARSQRQEAMLFTMAAVFGLLLVIVCLNVANLLTARGIAREYEIAMRLAIGASRKRIVRQLLTESVILAAAGGLAGLMVANWGKEILRTYFGEQLPLTIDLRALFFSTLVALTAGIIFGLVPAFQATRSTINDATKRSSWNNARPRTRLNQSLIVLQVAMSVVLLTGAGLLARSMNNWQRIDMGFNADGLVLFEVPPADPAESRRNSYGQIVERIAAIPGVTAVSTVECFPPNSCGSEVRTIGSTGPSRSVVSRRLVVQPNFFETMGLSLRAGRNFDNRDTPSGSRMAIVDEAMARQLFPSSNPVGQYLSVGRAPNAVEVEIVGVVSTAVIDIGRSQLRPMLYTSTTQTPQGIGTGFIIRSAIDQNIVMSQVRRAVAEIDSTLPLFGLTTFKQLVETELARQRQLSVTWLLFGITALVLTAIGVYGLMAYSVSRRINEIGLRLALGATRIDVLILVLWHVATVVVIGLVTGFTLSLAFNQVLWSFVFGVRVFDPQNFVIVSLVVGTIATVASYVPARRACRVNPVAALRCD